MGNFLLVFEKPGCAAGWENGDHECSSV